MRNGSRNNKPENRQLGRSDRRATRPAGAPGPSPIDFAERRARFLKELGSGVAVIASAPQLIRNSDVHFAYRQNSDFYYLTGFHEPDSVLLLAPQSKTPFQIFVHPKDPTREMWEGKVMGPESAKKLLGADAASPSIPEHFFEDAFIEAMLSADALHYRLGLFPDWDEKILRLTHRALRKLGRTGRPLWPLHDPQEILGEMRVVKSRPEIERLEKAGQITADAHVAAMKAAKPGMFEYEVEALLFHSFRASGALRVGYESIVASGPNACVLHYRDNNRQLAPKDLLLVDAGAEFDFYTADITRTFPVSGQFTPQQREVYQAVLTAQKSCIELARPGKTMRAIHEHATEVLIEELKKLKVLTGTTKQILEKRSHFPYYPHGTGHFLGMDVHDVGRYFTTSYEQPRKLEPGMALTIEPGLYFGPEGPGPQKYRGIGVRIEDDVVITAQGCKVMTAGVPKEVEEVEALCQNG
jgi:Xaa-Pro aminopeptidase